MHLSIELPYSVKIRISTRRFFALFSSELFGTIGCFAPNPFVSTAIVSGIPIVFKALINVLIYLKV